MPTLLLQPPMQSEAKWLPVPLSELELTVRTCWPEAQVLRGVRGRK